MNHIYPICGMTVSEHSKHHHRYGGEEFFFCSSGCLGKFKAEPDKYVHPEKEGANNCSVESCDIGSTFYTCPMHTEIRQKQAGACPKCGMTLEAIVELETTTHTQYTCPMHPEVVQDHPGSCPKCGMALEPKTVTTEEEIGRAHV